MINVAVSRAKKRLYIVASGNEVVDGNISDLISYIRYNNCEVVESKVYSIFDYLYSNYSDARMQYLKDKKRVSEYDSENLMNALTHLDFVLYSKISKKVLAAIEVDGYMYHKEGTRQAERDILKNSILQKYEIPLLRFSTNGSGEKERLSELLSKIR